MEYIPYTGFSGKNNIKIGLIDKIQKIEKKYNNAF